MRRYAKGAMQMRVYMLWHGGESYAPSALDDVEVFDTIKDAIADFDARADGWNKYYPCVTRDPEDGGQSAWIYFGAPPDPDDPYPDEVWEYGPRGGLRRTPA